MAHQGVDFRIEDMLGYCLPDRAFRLAQLAGGGKVRYLEIPASELADRVLLLDEIAVLDITPPPPATIYHAGESFLLQLSGLASTVATDGKTGTCKLWRYRAAGGRFLQIEAWPDRVRMLEGASVHRSMIDIRPATQGTHTE